MKRLLTLLGSIGLVATASSSVVACGQEMQPGALNGFNDNTNSKLTLTGAKFLWEKKSSKINDETISDNGAFIYISFNKGLGNYPLPSDMSITFTKQGENLKKGEKPTTVTVENNDSFSLDKSSNATSRNGSIIKLTLSKENAKQFSFGSKWNFEVKGLDCEVTNATGKIDSSQFYSGATFIVPNAGNIIN